MRRTDARREETGNNDEKAMTAVARAIRSITLQTPHPNRVRPGKGRRSGVRLKSTVDAAQLLTRGKLRRVERHWERSKKIGRAHVDSSH